jgi:hypothetical protein
MAEPAPIYINGRVAETSHIYASKANGATEKSLKETDYPLLSTYKRHRLAQSRKGIWLFLPNSAQC